jgi:hypothetical protein
MMKSGSGKSRLRHSFRLSGGKVAISIFGAAGVPALFNGSKMGSPSALGGISVWDGISS